MWRRARGVAWRLGLRQRREHRRSERARHRPQGADRIQAVGQQRDAGRFRIRRCRREGAGVSHGEVPEAHETGRGRPGLAIFATESCHGCALRGPCPTQTRKDRRVLSFTPEDAAVARRRVEQATPAFKERHKIRSGIAATNSELKRCHGLGKLRVRRRPRVALAVRLKVLQGSLRISPSDRDPSTKNQKFKFARLGIARLESLASDRSRDRGLVEHHRTAQLFREQRNEPWCSR